MKILRKTVLILIIIPEEQQQIILFLCKLINKMWQTIESDLISFSTSAFVSFSSFSPA